MCEAVGRHQFIDGVGFEIIPDATEPFLGEGFCGWRHGVPSWICQQAEGLEMFPARQRRRQYRRRGQLPRLMCEMAIGRRCDSDAVRSFGRYPPNSMRLAV